MSIGTTEGGGAFERSNPYGSKRARMNASIGLGGGQVQRRTVGQRGPVMWAKPGWGGTSGRLKSPVRQIKKIHARRRLYLLGLKRK